MATKTEIIDGVQLTNLLLHASKDPHTLSIVMFQASQLERDMMREVLQRAVDSRVTSKVA
jgi:hypothetical protein